MDNERHALESEVKQCKNCGFWKRFDWKQFREGKGLCDDVNNWHDETEGDSWCDQWKEVSE